MTATRLAWLAAIGTALAWGAKAVAIGVAGGLDKSPLEGPLVLLGFALSLVSTAALGTALVRERAVVVRVLVAVATMVVWFFALQAIDAVVGAVQPADRSWVWEEIGLWIGALLLIGFVASLRSRADGRRPDVAVA